MHWRRGARTAPANSRRREGLHGSDPVARERDRFLAGARNPDRRQELERTYALMTVPKTMPAYSEIEVDAIGNLWVMSAAPNHQAAHSLTEAACAVSAGRI